MTGRMYQDTHFNLSILNGLSIEQLKVCVNPDDGGVLIVYLKAEGQPIFHFFLDVGIAFCECWNAFLLEEGEKLRLYYCPTEDKSYFIKDNEVIR